MTLYLIDHVVVGLLVLVLPVVEFFFLRKRAAQISAGQTHLRMKLYRQIIREEWIGTIVILALWFGLGRGAANLGLIPRFDALAWGGYALGLAVCGLLWWQMRSIIAKPDGFESFRKQIGWLSFLTPHTAKELRAFRWVSVTAGICEEILFRGFFPAYAAALLGVPVWGALALSALVFGVAHAYQGPVGILRTGFVGAVMALLYGMTGSLWTPIVAHAVMDLTSGRMSYEAFRDHDAPGDDRPELAA